MLEQFEVIVLGGGPAGCSVAIGLAKQGVRVAILERTNYERFRIGEMLPPEAAPLLVQLGVWEDFLQGGHLESSGISFAWSGPNIESNDFIFSPLGNGWHLDRLSFDQMLIRAAEAAGAAAYRETHATGLQRTENGNWRLSASSPESSRQLSARFLVDATGRSAWLVRRLEVPRKAYDRLVGIIAVLEETVSIDRRLLVESYEDGWWYSGRLPGDRAIAACMTDSDYVPHNREGLVEFWKASLWLAPHTQNAVGNHAMIRSLRTVSANSVRSELTFGVDWVAIGDAAMAFDPLSARGISKSLESALKVSHLIVNAIRGQPNALVEYSIWIEKEFENYFRNYKRFYTSAQSWKESAFWKRRATL